MPLLESAVPFQSIAFPGIPYGYLPVRINKEAARLAECLARNPWRVLGVALLLTVLATWAASHLPVYTSRQALLPKDMEVTQRFERFLQNFGAAADLIVVLEGAPQADLESFASRLADKLRNEPEIGQATDRLDMRFFLEHAYLSMPLEQLQQLGAGLSGLSAAQPPGLEEALSKAGAWVQAGPSSAMAVDLVSARQGLELADDFFREWRRWLDAEQVPQAVDWNPLLARYGAESGGNGFFTSRDGRLLFVFAHPKNASEDFDNLGPFVDKVKSVSAGLAAQWRAEGRAAPVVGFTGLPAIEYEEYINIRKDILLVIATSALLISILILAVVRSVRWAAVIFVPMGLGVVWSLGLALVTVGHLTIITAAFIAILFGLGADYGIFTSSRITEERRAGRPLVEAIGVGISSSFSAVLTAGGASLLIFAALGTVDFPGFAELGVVAAKGVLMILLATWLVQPALYALLPPKIHGVAKPGASAAMAVPRFKWGAYPRPVAGILVLLALGCAVAGAVYGLKIPFDYDVLAMLPADSQAAHYQRRMDLESDYQAEVVIFTAKDMAEARRISEEAGRYRTIGKVQSLSKLFPADAEARAHWARVIAEPLAAPSHALRLDEFDRAGLSARSFELLRALLAGGEGFIDSAQEQAFSSGHNEWVQSLEKLRGSLSAVKAGLDRDGEQGRVRTEAFARALLDNARLGLAIASAWKTAEPLTPRQLPASLRDRFFGRDGSVAVYAFPAETVYDPVKLDALMRDVYAVSPDATGFPSTHQVFSKQVVESFSQGTLLALAVCLLWIMVVMRSLAGFALAALPLLIGGGWMLGLMALFGIQYNYANIVALPLVIALAVDYGVWYSYRWRDLSGYAPFQVSWISGKVIGLAAGTELAGLGAITLAHYRGVSTMGINITIGLLCCLAATLFVAPAIGQLLDSKRKTQ